LIAKGPERKDIINAVTLLKRAKKPMFKCLAQMLSSPTRARPSVNVSKIARHTKQNAIVAVGGKVMGDGVIGHPVEVAALSFSDSAARKIREAGGKCHDFKWLVEHGVKDVILLK